MPRAGSLAPRRQAVQGGRLTRSVEALQLEQFVFGGELASTEDGLRMARAVVGHQAT